MRDQGEPKGKGREKQGRDCTHSWCVMGRHSSIPAIMLDVSDDMMASEYKRGGYGCCQMVVLYIVALYYTRNTRFHSRRILDSKMLSLSVRQLRSIQRISFPYVWIEGGICLDGEYCKKTVAILGDVIIRRESCEPWLKLRVAGFMSRYDDELTKHVKRDETSSTIPFIRNHLRNPLLEYQGDYQLHYRKQ